MRKFYMISILLISISIASCATKRASLEDLPESTKKFGAFSFIRENQDMVVVVDVELAQRRKSEDYFPLGVKIANKNLDSLTLERECFILVDQNDDIYYMPDVLELQRQYDKLVSDHKFKSQTGLLADQMLTSFTYFREAESNFFPQTQGAARVLDWVYIQKKGYMEDLIYFPMPPGGIEGKKLKLRLDAYELETAFEIIFIVK